MKRTTPPPRTAKASRRVRTVTSRSEAGTEQIAARFAKTLRGGEVILLDGDLGAGKTVFVRGLARGLGVRDRITSPTFVLMRIHRAISPKLKAISPKRRIANNRTPLTAYLADERAMPVRWKSNRYPSEESRYQAKRRYGLRLTAPRYLVHVDAYRINNPSALEAIGLLEWAGKPDTIVAIEWGEHVRDLFPRSTHTVHRVHLSSPTNTQRILRLQ